MKAHKKPFAVGVDLGTGSCKTILLSPTGEVLGHAFANYSADDKESRWQEQHPESLLNGVIHSVRQAVESSGLMPTECLGISIGGALHSITVLDKENQPLVGVLTWVDNRAISQADAIRKSGIAHDLYLRTGCPIHPMYPFIKIIWFRENHPDLFSKAAWFISAKEYVTYQLTQKRYIDYGVASGSGLVNIHDLTWDEKVLQVAGISDKQLFTLSSPQSMIGGLIPEIANQMGLLAGTMVYQGSSDAFNSSMGSGTIFPHQVTCMVGTSGAIRCISDHPVLDEQERTWCYAVDNSHRIIGGAINNGGIAMNWLKDALSTGLRENECGPSFNDLMVWADEITAGSNGLICLPFLTGERSPYWNSNARGIYYGLQLGHDQRHLCRSLLEGIAYRLRSVLDVLDEIHPGLTEVRASGGFVQSRTWLQITSDVLNRTLFIPADKEASGVAAAYWVLMAQGVLPSLEKIGSSIPIIDKIEPNKENKNIYDQQFIIYQQLYQSLKPVFELSKKS